jgi:hypothetical protein
LSDVRRLVEQSREAVFRMESALATSDPGASLRVAELVDGVRAMAERTSRRQTWLMGAVAVQAVLLAIALGFILLMRSDAQRPPLLASDVTAEQTISSAVDTSTGTPETHLTSQTQQTDDVKHRRRRHR